MNRVIIVLLCCLCTVANAKDFAKEKQERLIGSLLKQQVKQQISIENSVESLLTRYPEKVDLIVTTAIKLYPSDYKSIMKGAMEAEPVLSCSVLEAMMASNVASTEQLLTQAINLEPAYSHELMITAAKARPDNFDNILRVTLKTEPLLSNSIVDKTMEAYPEKLLSILVSAIRELPNNISSYMKAAFNVSTSTNEQPAVDTFTLKEQEHLEEVFNAAMSAGMTKQDAMRVALNSGINQEMLDKLNIEN